MMFRVAYFLTLVSAAALTACSDEAEQKTPTPTPQAVTAPAAPAPPPPEPERPTLRPVEAATGKLAAAEAYLRTVMPAEAYAYVRIPSVWGVLGAPKGTIYDKAISSAPYASAVNAIREGLGADVLPDVPREARALVGLVSVYLRSPVEAILLPPASPGPPIPSLLLSATLDFTDVAAFKAFVDELVQLDPSIQLASPIDAQGNGVIVAGNAPMTLRFSSADSRLYVLVGMQPDPAALATRLEGLSANPDHPMRAVEAELDASGQGLYAWVDPKQALELMQTMGQVQQAAMLSAFGAAEMEGLAVGLGSARGALRLKLVAKMPPVGFRAYTPVMRYDLGLQAAGDPSMVFVLGLPSSGDLANIEKSVLANLSPSENQDYLDAKQKVHEKLGVTVEALLDIFGQELVAVFDDAGRYAAMRIADPQAFEALLQRSVAE
ncbi:MAG: hypothetical protein ACR2RL_01310, partial [Gammaproteobacteria bacterium]